MKQRRGDSRFRSGVVWSIRDLLGECEMIEMATLSGRDS
jgi:hypothetical protein